MSEIHHAERAMLRTAMRDGGLLAVGLAVVGGVVGLVVAGPAGMYAALGAGVVVGFFCGTTVWSMWISAGKSPTTMAAYVMGSWLAKVVVLLVVLLTTRGMIADLPTAARFVVLAVVTLGAIGSAALDYRAVRRGRIPYVGE